MLDFKEFFAFAIAAFLIVIVPGPNMTYLITCAAKHGRKAAFVALLGSNLALISLGIMIGIGLNTLIQTFPLFYVVLKTLGAFYLFWLAWKNITNRKSLADKQIELMHYSKKKIFRNGYLTNLLNPKSAVFYISILPGFLDVHNGYIILQSVELSFIHAIVSFFVNSVIIYSVSHVVTRINSSERIKIIGKWITATFFTAFGIRMLIQQKI